MYSIHACFGYSPLLIPVFTCFASTTSKLEILPLDFLLPTISCVMLAVNSRKSFSYATEMLMVHTIRNTTYKSVDANGKERCTVCRQRDASATPTISKIIYDKHIVHPRTEIFGEMLLRYTYHTYDASNPQPGDVNVSAYACVCSRIKRKNHTHTHTYYMHTAHSSLDFWQRKSLNGKIQSPI